MVSCSGRERSRVALNSLCDSVYLTFETRQSWGVGGRWGGGRLGRATWCDSNPVLVAVTRVETCVRTPRGGPCVVYGGTSSRVDLKPPLRPPVGQKGGQRKGIRLSEPVMCPCLLCRGARDPFCSQPRLLLPRSRWAGLA